MKARPASDSFLYVAGGPASPTGARYKTIASAAATAKYSIIGAPTEEMPPALASSTAAIARADVVIADVTQADPATLFDLGIAFSLDRPTICLTNALLDSHLPKQLLLSGRVLRYEQTDQGIRTLERHLASALERIRQSPSTPRRNAFRSSDGSPYIIEWDRLAAADIDNLLRELLMQMGFTNIEWKTDDTGFDMVADLPRRDPDGFDYKETWFVWFDYRHSVRTDAPIAVQRARLERAMRMSHRFIDPHRSTILFLLLGEETDKSRQTTPLWDPSGAMKGGGGIRTRFWHRAQLTTLVQQYPQLAYKYFSDDAPAITRSAHRKSTRELYDENATLSARILQVLNELQTERVKRIRAEREAIWKDISFSAAHKLGNPIFAIETNLTSLGRRLDNGKVEEARSVLSETMLSVEKAKAIIHQFKSLSHAESIKPLPCKLRPLLEAACAVAQSKGYTCKTSCDPSLEIHVDPDRISECLDELIANAMNFLPPTSGTISLTARHAKVENDRARPSESAKWIEITVADNGVGVEKQNKRKIFDLFFTSRADGTGIGLPVVRRIVEAHGGTVEEVGVPGNGAEFRILLPETVVVPPKDSSLVPSLQGGKEPTDSGGSSAK